MAKSNKKIKRLKKRVKKLTAANLTLEKRIRKLEKRLADRKPTVEHPSGLSQDAPITQATDPSTAEIGAQDGNGIASRQRAAWKQHSYLRDRYEFHLDAGASKEVARQRANDDLEARYGAGSGYSEDELGAILS